MGTVRTFWYASLVYTPILNLVFIELSGIGRGTVQTPNLDTSHLRRFRWPRVSIA